MNTGGTLQRISTGKVHVSRTKARRDLTLCGLEYYIDGWKWNWSYDENETGSCIHCMRRHGASEFDIDQERVRIAKKRGGR